MSWVKRLQSFLARHEWVIPLTLAILFILITLPTTDWGVPNGWNPDELVQRVIKALHGEWIFDQNNFDYPSLPKWAMYWLGRLVQSWGLGDGEVMLAARKLSVQLGAAVVAMSYAITRRLGAGRGAAALAALLVLTNSELAQQARYAHNDIYLAFFVTLAVWASLRYAQSGQRGWFYAACALVGMAASSKYNGVAMLLLPMALFLLLRGRALWQDWWSSAEQFAIGAVAAGLGYALGTPKALTWMAFYFKRAIPALQANGNYGYRPGAQTGLLGQFTILGHVLGQGLFWMSVAALGFALVRGIQRWRADGLRAALPGLVLPAAILAFDVPIMLSYNYPERFFLPLVPLAAVLVAQLAEWLWNQAKQRSNPAGRWALVSGFAILLLWSSLRVASVGLLFANDGRRAAGEFLAKLPAAESVEYTYYPPIINRANFDRAHNYPLYFIKQFGEEVPEGRFFPNNTGFDGINDRQPQYLVVDSFTYKRFEDAYTCELHPTDCEFFQALLAGEAGFTLVGNFEYDLPTWMPTLRISFVNPDIRVYERAK